VSGKFFTAVGVFSAQLVLSVGFEAMALPTAKFNGIHRSGMNSKTGFRSIHVVGGAPCAA